MTFIIADACVNFRGLSDADALIKGAAHSKCDAIKFQMFKEEHITGHPRYNELKNIILSEEDIRYLSYRCQYWGIEFMCTPFYSSAVDVLKDYVFRWKIRFADRNNVELIKKCLDTNMDLLISDNQLPEVKTEEIKTLYCIPEYPPKTEWDIVNKLKGYDGFSSHFPNVRTDWMVAKNNNLDYLEIHLRLNSYGCGDFTPIDQRVSITMDELAWLCKELGG